MGGLPECRLKPTRTIMYATVDLFGRIYVAEFQTISKAVANLLNARPIGTVLSIDANVNVLAPHNLLLVRWTAKNPYGWKPFECRQSTPRKRYHFGSDSNIRFLGKVGRLYALTLVIQ